MDTKRQAAAAVFVGLLHRPMRADELPDVRALWWRLRGQGVPVPAEHGVIVLDGDRP